MTCVERQLTCRAEIRGYLKSMAASIDIPALTPGTSLTGRVAQLVPEENYGIVTTDDGRKLCFSREDVVGNRFNLLQVGTRVEITVLHNSDPRRRASIDMLS